VRLERRISQSTFESVPSVALILSNGFLDLDLDFDLDLDQSIAVRISRSCPHLVQDQDQDQDKPGRLLRIGTTLSVPNPLSLAGVTVS
jgi:hypothetical protein